MAHLLVVDAGNFVMRAYHGWPAEGPDHHVEGFRVMLLKLLRDWQPTHLVVALDCDGASFRATTYPAYKAHREDRPGPRPDDLIPSLLPALSEWGVVAIRAPEFEGDDVMATLARRGRCAGSTVSLVSNDSDMYQCVGGGVRVLRFLPGREVETVDEAWLMDRWGIGPERVADFKALCGDSSDNIPRVGETSASGRRSGYTEKLAAEHLRRFGDLDGVLDAVPLLPARVGRWLGACGEDARRFRALIRLRDDLPLEGVDPRLAHVSHLRLSHGAPYRAPSQRV